MKLPGSVNQGITKRSDAGGRGGKGTHSGRRGASIGKGPTRKMDNWVIGKRGERKPGCLGGQVGAIAKRPKQKEGRENWGADARPSQITLKKKVEGSGNMERMEKKSGGEKGLQGGKGGVE